MTTPICDFIKKYTDDGVIRLHMPGHKGKSVTGVEWADITEVDGADVLYNASGIIKESQSNAASLFGTAGTVYSTEGSSLAIRAMLYLATVYAKQIGKPPVITAGRNAHKTFVTAAALLDFEIDWIYGDNLLSCNITADMLDSHLTDTKPVAVYITSPDYLGNVADIRSLAKVCRNHGVLLLVDNAHGAYLKFLAESRHPITLGADMCCDSAHKTLPVLTGGAYLHISKTAPTMLYDNVCHAMSVFASTSPSYLILQSLDMANRYLAGGYTEQLYKLTEKISELKCQLTDNGYTLIGDEPLKITVSAKPYGYTGHQLYKLLQDNNMECEFCDADFVTMMFTPHNSDDTLQKLCCVLCDIPRKPPITDIPPSITKGQSVMTPRQAMLSPSVTLPLSECIGRVLASPTVSCPPAVPIRISGELIDELAVQAFRYYGIDYCNIVK